MTDKTPEPAFNLNFETVGSLVAMLIGAVALFVAWDQAQVMRKQQHASVWPIIETDLTIDGDENTRFVKFLVSNAGVGPALIESAKLTINGQDITTLGAFRAALLPDSLGGRTGFGGSGLEGSVLAPGQSTTALQLVWERSDEIDTAFNDFARGFVGTNAPDVSLDICYCSVFEKCWRSKSSTRPSPVKICPPETGFLQNFIDSPQGDK